jgi:hypothetical protein
MFLNSTTSRTAASVGWKRLEGWSKRRDPMSDSGKMNEGIPPLTGGDDFLNLL